MKHLKQASETLAKTLEKHLKIICKHMQNSDETLANIYMKCDRIVQFIQDQVWLSPLNTLTRLYRHLFKSGSPLSTTKGLNKSTSQPKSYLIKQIPITYT
jgi:hypothetical protein